MRQEQLKRLLQLIEVLQGGQRWPIDALAVECGVSRRTIFRDLGVLRECGIPLRLDNQSRRYFMGECGGMLRPIDFSTEEAIALSVMVHELAGKTGLPFLGPARKAVLKLQSVLPAALREQLRELTDAVRIRPTPRTELDAKTPIYERILEALTLRRAVRIEYKGPLAEKSIHTKLNPYRLLFSRRSWYVIGRSSIHRTVRTFHIGRIIELAETDDTYTVPRGFSIERYLGNAWHMIPEPGPDIDVAIRFTPLVATNVAEVNWHKTQRFVFLEDGSLDYHVKVSGLGEITWWILGYGATAKVLQPEELRDRVAQQLRTTLQQYE